MYAALSAQHEQARELEEKVCALTLLVYEAFKLLVYAPLTAHHKQARELEERLEQRVRAERALQQQQQQHDTELERLRKEHLAANKASNADLEQVLNPKS